MKKMVGIRGPPLYKDSPYYRRLIGRSEILFRSRRWAAVFSADWRVYKVRAKKGCIQAAAESEQNRNTNACTERVWLL